MEPKRRGRPPGSTNKVKPDAALAPPEARIADRTADLIDVLLDKAIDERDDKVAIYLLNRVLGKPTDRSEVLTKGEQTIKVEYVEDWRNG